MLRDLRDSCSKLHTALIEVGDGPGLCEVCAKYRKRIYSLSKDEHRFPPFPKDFHFGCTLRPFVFQENISYPSFECNDIIQYSNRPFVDDRTDLEKAEYEERISSLKENAVEDEDLEEKIRQAQISKVIYLHLKKILPNDVPKSQSGFSRMRNSNSKNYQKLESAAKNLGFLFPKTIKEALALLSIKLD